LGLIRFSKSDIPLLPPQTILEGPIIMRRIVLILFGLGLISMTTGCCCFRNPCNPCGPCGTASFQQPAQFSSVAAAPSCGCNTF
jgi:hypothetical protein